MLLERLGTAGCDAACTASRMGIRYAFICCSSNFLKGERDRTLPGDTMGLWARMVAASHGTLAHVACYSRTITSSRRHPNNAFRRSC